MCIVNLVIPLHTQAHTHTVEAVYRAQFTMIEEKHGIFCPKVHSCRTVHDSTPVFIVEKNQY